MIVLQRLKAHSHVEDHLQQPILDLQRAESIVLDKINPSGNERLDSFCALIKNHTAKLIQRLRILRQQFPAISEALLQTLELSNRRFR
ncbi:hypothetical protein D3C86_2082780 [compost metagenome]